MSVYRPKRISDTYIRVWSGRELSGKRGNYVSKIDQNESAIHISGCGLDESFQGREVIMSVK